MWLRPLVLSMMLSLAGCTTVALQPVQPNFYVMRHLHTPAGVKDPDLTAQGHRSALALAAWFSRDPPGVIYVSTPKRAQQTAAPLAKRFRQIPKTYDPADTPGLVAAVLKEPGTVLIVGHSNTVPEIIARLGGQRPAALVHEDFGDIWHVQGPGRVTSHAKLPSK